MFEVLENAIWGGFKNEGNSLLEEVEAGGDTTKLAVLSVDEDLNEVLKGRRVFFKDTLSKGVFLASELFFIKVDSIPEGFTKSGNSLGEFESPLNSSPDSEL